MTLPPPFIFIQRFSHENNLIFSTCTVLLHLNIEHLKVFNLLGNLTSILTFVHIR